MAIEFNAAYSLSLQFVTSGTYGRKQIKIIAKERCRRR